MPNCSRFASTAISRTGKNSCAFFPSSQRSAVRSFVAVLAVVLAIGAAPLSHAQSGARVTVVSKGSVPVTPDGYRFWVGYYVTGPESPEVETTTGQLTDRVRQALVDADGTPREINVVVSAKLLNVSGEDGNGEPSGESSIELTVDANSLGGPGERLPRLAELRKILEQELKTFAEESAANDSTSVSGPLAVLDDETAYRQAAIGAAVKASLADGEAAASALQAVVRSTESMEVEKTACEWTLAGNGRATTQGDYVATVKVVYIVGSAR